MSVLFPKVNKPREWDYRPIYYDEEKEARKQKLARLRALREQKEQSEGDKSGSESAEHITTLHRGSFREAHEAQTKLRIDTEHKSKLTFWIVLLALLIFVFYWLL